ncbi:MAG TPA: DUF1697 domain-containing protein [Pyrinomonadaceae bacterium]|nr:DUF1697 domain-containing protein [Pyrinomonadaceae bacterium]
MRYVALLRGINVGGNTMIKMEELRRTFEALGFERVVSYINSGNLAFDSPKGSDVKLAAMIEKAVEGLIGKNVSVMVREQKHILQVLANNPFDGQYASHKEMHVLFMKDEMPPEKQEQLRSLAPARERFEIAGREIYCHLPMGVADSLMGRGLFEKKLKVSVTARNWRTVETIAKL